MRLLFKKIVHELQPSDLIFSPVLRSPGSVACTEADHSYEGRGSTAVCEVGSSLLSVLEEGSSVGGQQRRRLNNGGGGS